MHERPRSSVRLALLYALTVAGIGAHVSLSLLDLPAERVLDPLSFVVAVVGSALVGRQHNRRAWSGGRRVPLLLIAGLTCAGLGEVMGALHTSTSRTEVSWGDLVLLSAYLLVGAALVSVQLRRLQVAGIDSLIDVLTVLTACFLLFWGLAIEAILFDDAAAPLVRALLAVYPLLDAVLLALVLRVLVDRRSRSWTSLRLTAGVACWLVADTADLLGDSAGLVTVLSTGSIVGSVLLARVIFVPVARGPVPEADDLGSWGVVRRSAVTVLPLVVAMALPVLDAEPGETRDVWVQAIGVGLLLTLTFARTARLLESDRVTRHQLGEARDAALEASRAKSSFLATMSHEIRTPMNGVIGLTGLLQATDLDERQRQYADGVHGAGQQLLTIINDILDFSKVEAGHLELEEIDFDVSEVLEQATELLAEIARGKGLELLAYCAPDLPLGLRGDPTRLRQVLVNLVGNAVKFTAAGEVVVSARLVSRHADGTVSVRFEVRDTGVGIDPRQQEHLFEPFAQADTSTTRRYGGTGLGLAISHQLVTAMGGGLDLTSVPGQGSTFGFEVALQPAQDPSTAAVAPAEALQGAKVLIVDDNQTNRLVLHQQLAAWGLEPSLAADGPAALALTRTAADLGDPFQLAVLDMVMPDMNGLEIARAVSRGRPPRPAMVLLTSGPEITVAEAQDAGIAARLTKPIHLVRLREALVQAIGSRRDDLPATDPPAQPEPAERPSRGHVLVVEDSEINQLVAIGILEHLGFTTELADDGRAALALLEHTTYDVVLMDCQMPDIDGYEATRELRRRESGRRRTPVIALTAGAVEGERERCLAAGMDDYLTKPIEPVDVDAVVSRWLAEPAV